MAPFCIVGIPILFPCLPQPLPPKIKSSLIKSLFYLLIREVRGFTAFKRNEIINELDV